MDRALLLALLGLFADSASACIKSSDWQVLEQTPVVLARADLVVQARTVEVSPPRRGAESYRITLNVERVFKGRSQPTLRFAVRSPGCSAYPRVGESGYLFLTAGVGFVDMDYVPEQRTPQDFESRLGRAGVPGADTTRLQLPVPTLAPSDVPQKSVLRTEIDGIATDSWSVTLWPVGHWAIPRFYIRYPDGFVFFEPGDVEAAARDWGDADLVREVLRELPLKTPRDLYQFTLMGRYPRGESSQLEKFAVDSLLAGRAVVLTRSGYLGEVRVTRNVLGEQRFSFGDDDVTLLTSRYPVPIAPSRNRTQITTTGR